MAPHIGNLKLPRAILDQIGGPGVVTQGKFRSHPNTRKGLRKAARKDQKSSRQILPPKKRIKLRHAASRYEEPSSPLETSSTCSNDTTQETDGASKLQAQPNILSKSEATCTQNNLTCPVSPPRISKAVLEKLAEDDREIAALEKKLKLKGSKNLPQSFKDDGLDELLEGLGNGETSELEEDRRTKAESMEWLSHKRMKAQSSLSKSKPQTIDSDSEDVKSQMSSEPGTMEPNEMMSGEDMLDSESFDGFESETEIKTTRKRENPYVPPTISAVKKYVPPSLRNVIPSDCEELVRLRRRTQGLVNRLTESNLISILGDIENLYRVNPRGHVTLILVDILLASILEPTSLPATLIILPAGFIAAIYKVIGTDFGAQVVQKIVELFDEHYTRARTMSLSHSGSEKIDSSKETSNLIMLLAELFNFQVVASNLVFDYIRLFLSELSELNTELLLRIIRSSGPQLRQDDPSSLSEIITMLQQAMASAGEKNVSVRTKFMVETIEKLKNNRMKTGLAASAVTSEHTIRMKKILGSLSGRAIKATEPLRVGLKDIQESDKKGKWWLVGASWSGDVRKDPEQLGTNDDEKTIFPVQDPGTVDLLQLAQEQRMNTDVRRAIFITLMSGTDYQDAYARLTKLKLKKVQEYQIAKVLIRCAATEKSYNPYYTLVAQKICGDKKLRMSFQYCLWDLFKQMGESEDVDVNVDEGEDLDTRHIVNLAKMYGNLIAEKVISLAVLKNLNLSYLQAKTAIFVEVMLITIFLQSKKDEKLVAGIFSTVHDIPHLITRLQYFLRKVVRKTDIAGGKQAKETVKLGCKMAIDTLQRLLDMGS